MIEDCTICGKPTEPEKRRIVTTPEGTIEYYCMGGCADARTDALIPDKQFRTFEGKEKAAYLKSLQNGK